MIQHLKQNIFFFISLISSIACFTLLWIFFGLGISFGTFFIYQGLFMVIPYSEVSMEKRLNISLLMTGLIIGPLNTIVFTLLCLDYIFGYKIPIFSYIMGFQDSQELIKAAFIEYSIALAINITYLIIIFIAQKRYQQSIQNHNMFYTSHLQNNNQIRNILNNQTSLQVQNIIQNMNNQNNNGINFNNIRIVSNLNQQSNILNQNSININEVFDQIRYQLQYQSQSESNLSGFEEDEDEFEGVFLNGQVLIKGNADDERQDAVKTTVCSRDGESKDEGKECAICYEEFDKIKSLACNHTFHATCIRTSIKSIGWKCPYCRAKINYKISKCKQQNQRSNIRHFQNFVLIDSAQDIENIQNFANRQRVRGYNDFEVILI